MLPGCIICCESSLKTLTMWGDSVNRSCEWKQSQTRHYTEWKDLNHRTRWCAECSTKHSRPRKDHYRTKSTQKAQHNNNACHNIPRPKQPSARNSRDHLTNRSLCAIISSFAWPSIPLLVILIKTCLRIKCVYLIMYYK